MRHSSSRAGAHKGQGLPCRLTSEMETPLRYQVTVGFREALLRQCRYPGLLSSSWLSLGISTHLGTAGHKGKGLHRATCHPLASSSAERTGSVQRAMGPQLSHERCLSISEGMSHAAQLTLTPYAAPLLLPPFSESFLLATVMLSSCFFSPALLAAWHV